MPSQTLNLDARIHAINAVLTKKADQQLVGEALKVANGDWPTALGSLKGKLPPAALRKLDLAHSLADWSGDNVGLVKALSGRPNLTSLRDVALHFDADRLAPLVDPQAVPADVPGA